MHNLLVVFGLGKYDPARWTMILPPLQDFGKASAIHDVLSTGFLYSNVLQVSSSGGEGGGWALEGWVIVIEPFPMAAMIQAMRLSYLSCHAKCTCELEQSPGLPLGVPAHLFLPSISPSFCSTEVGEMPSDDADEDGYKKAEYVRKTRTDTFLQNEMTRFNAMLSLTFAYMLSAATRLVFQLANTDRQNLEAEQNQKQGATKQRRRFFGKNQCWPSSESGAHLFQAQLDRHKNDLFETDKPLVGQHS